MNKLQVMMMGLVTLSVLTGCNNNPKPSETPTSSEPPTTSEVPSSNSEVEVPVTPAFELTPAPKYTGDYWAPIMSSTNTGEALRAELNAFMWARFRKIDYNTCWTALNEIDQDPKNPSNIISLYDLHSIPKSSQSHYNREHSFPQSKLADGDDSLRAKTTVKNISSDVANLFFCDSDLNTQRSNYSYWGLNIEEKYYSYAIRNSYGTLTDNFLYKGHYSPTPKVRGEIARAQLYMLVMYPDNCSLGENFDIVTMLGWLNTYPASVERDLQRQAGLEKWQNLRNPFIDHPELGCRIFGQYDTYKKVCK